MPVKACAPTAAPSTCGHLASVKEASDALQLLFGGSALHDSLVSLDTAKSQMAGGKDRPSDLHRLVIRPASRSTALESDFDQDVQRTAGAKPFANGRELLDMRDRIAETVKFKIRAGIEFPEYVLDCASADQLIGEKYPVEAAAPRDPNLVRGGERYGPGPIL